MNKNAVKVVQLELKSSDLTCAFSPDRKRAVTGVVNKSVRMWDLETGKCIRQLEGHKERIWGLAWAQISGTFYQDRSTTLQGFGMPIPANACKSWKVTKGSFVI